MIVMHLKDTPHRWRASALLLIAAGALVVIARQQNDPNDWPAIRQAPPGAADAIAAASVSSASELSSQNSAEARVDLPSGNDAMVEFEMPDLVHGFCMCHPFGLFRIAQAAALQAPAMDADVIEAERGIYRYFPTSARRAAGAAPMETGPVR